MVAPGCGFQSPKYELVISARSWTWTVHSGFLLTLCTCTLVPQEHIYSCSTRTHVFMLNKSTFVLAEQSTCVLVEETSPGKTMTIGHWDDLGSGGVLCKTFLDWASDFFSGLAFLSLLCRSGRYPDVGISGGTLEPSRHCKLGRRAHRDFFRSKRQRHFWQITPT